VAEKITLDRLEELAKTMKDWERKPIVKVGNAVVELVKLPRREGRRTVNPEKLALHVKLENSFKGIYIENIEELEDVLAALTHDTTKAVAEAITRINKGKAVEFTL